MEQNRKHVKNLDYENKFNDLSKRFEEMTVANKNEKKLLKEANAKLKLQIASDKNDLQHHLEDLQKELNSSYVEHKGMIAGRDELILELSRRENEIKELRTQLPDVSEGDMKSYLSNIEEKVNQEESLKKEIGILNDKIEKKDTELTKRMAERNSLLKRNKELNGMMDNQNKLKDELSNVEKEKEQLKKELKDASEKDKESLLSKIKEKENKITSLNQQIIELEKKIEEKNIQLEKEKTENIELKKKREGMISLVELESRMDIMQSNIVAEMKKMFSNAKNE